MPPFFTELVELARFRRRVIMSLQGRRLGWAPGHPLVLNSEHGDEQTRPVFFCWTAAALFHNGDFAAVAIREHNFRDLPK